MDPEEQLLSKGEENQCLLSKLDGPVLVDFSRIVVSGTLEVVVVDRKSADVSRNRDRKLA